MASIHYDPDVSLLCCFQQHLTGWRFDNLSAPFWRLYWNRSHGATVFLLGQELNMDPDMFYLIPPNTPFASCLTQPLDHLYVHFTVREPYYSLKPEIFEFPLENEILKLVSEISTSIETEEYNDQRFCMLVSALAHFALAKVPADRLKLYRTDPRIDHVLEAMELHLDRKQPNERLAEVAGMHTNAFTRLFRKVTGYSPQRYLNMKRIERACIMLHSMSVSIEEIAESLGFCDRYHFSRVFKQIRGMGPAAFQKTLIIPDNLQADEP